MLTSILTLVTVIQLLSTSVSGLVAFNTTSARECRVDCINRYGTFCSNVDYTEGTCCDWEGVSCRNYGICANDIPEDKRNTGLEYFVCPHEEFCGDLYHIVENKTKSINITAPEYTDQNMCTYHFKFDMKAGPSDIMTL
jgi:hypothetical protein